MNRRTDATFPIDQASFKEFDATATDRVLEIWWWMHYSHDFTLGANQNDNRMNIPSHRDNDFRQICPMATQESRPVDRCGHGFYEFRVSDVPTCRALPASNSSDIVQTDGLAASKGCLDRADDLGDEDALIDAWGGNHA